MNNVVVCGHMGQDPEMRFTQSGRPCCRFSIADGRPPDKDGNEQTQWFNCRAFDRTAELINEHFGKGKPIWVSGELHARLYARNDGTAGLSLDVQVSSFSFVPFGQRRREDDPAEPAPPEPRQPSQAAAPAAVPQAGGELDVPDITDPFADQ